MRQKLTLLLTCKNEVHNLPLCIESAAGLADEVLVADSGSTDGTLELARELADRVIEREYVHSGSFKNWAIPQCTHPWVLILDCDERVTPALAAEIRGLLDGQPACDGYWVSRQNFFLGHAIHRGSWGADRVLRLFRQDQGRYVEHTDHAEVRITSGRVGNLRGKLLHYTAMTYASYGQRFFRYALQQAELWHRQGRRPSAFQLLFRGPWRFFHNYVLRGGFLDGMPGLQVSLLIGANSYLKQALLWQLYYGRSQRDLETRAGAAHPNETPALEPPSRQAA